MKFNRIAESISGSSFKDFVFGFQDGLISTYVLIVGIGVLVLFSPIMLIIALLAEIASGAISMGFGAYISTKTENELIEKPDEENINGKINQVKDLFVKNEISDQEIELTKAFFNNNPNLLEKLKINQKESKLQKDPVNNALLMSFAFVLGGILPLAPYIIPMPTWSFILATIFSFSGLFIIGFLRKYITESSKHWIKPALEMILLGILAIVIIGIYLYFISLFYGILIFS